MSELVNAAVRRSLAEDADDLAALHERAEDLRPVDAELTMTVVREGNRREVYREAGATEPRQRPSTTDVMPR